MILRKITIDNSVRYIPKSEQIKQKRLNQKKQKLAHSLVNKTKNHHKTKKSFLKIFQHQDLNILQNSVFTCI